MDAGGDWGREAAAAEASGLDDRCAGGDGDDSLTFRFSNEVKQDGRGVDAVRGFGRLLLCFGVTGGLWAQTGRRPPVPRPVREGCPAVVPPSDSSTVATAADFIELKRTACAEGCPAYTVRIGGDGRVAWMGERFVEMKGSAAEVIDVIAARELMQRVS